MNFQELRERVLRGKYRIPFYMSTDCENLLKKFLVLNPARRGTLEQIMKDRSGFVLCLSHLPRTVHSCFLLVTLVNCLLPLTHCFFSSHLSRQFPYCPNYRFLYRWMNIGYEDDELKPYIELPKDQRDERRILKLQAMGFTAQQIHDALDKERFEDVHATYLLLGEKSAQTETAKLPESASATVQSTTSSSSQQQATSQTSDQPQLTPNSNTINILPNNQSQRSYTPRSNSAQVPNNIRPNRRASHIDSTTSSQVQPPTTAMGGVSLTPRTSTAQPNNSVLFRPGPIPSRQPVLSMQTPGTHSSMFHVFTISIN